MTSKNTQNSHRWGWAKKARAFQAVERGEQGPGGGECLQGINNGVEPETSIKGVGRKI